MAETLDSQAQRAADLPSRPLGERLAAGETIPASEAAPPAEVLPCQKCGLPMPAMTEDALEAYRAAVNAGVPVVLAHEVCPGTEPAAPTGRYFEARVSIVEVTEVDHGGLGDATPTVRADELMSFVVGHRDTNLVKAMRPLAEALGAKWMDGEKRAHIADAPAMAAEAGS
jgi:hypothetical protein